MDMCLMTPDALMTLYMALRHLAYDRDATDCLDISQKYHNREALPKLPVRVIQVWALDPRTIETLLMVE
jgi:hypothetical protein